MLSKNLLVAFPLLLAVGTGCSPAVGDDEVGSGDQAVTNDAMAPEIIGEYALDSDTVGGTLKIRSVGLFVRFDLSVVDRRTTHIGELVMAYAPVVDGVATFKGDGDCEIAIKRDGEALKLTQVGTCSEEGFGAFLDVSGTYKKNAVAPNSMSAELTGKHNLQSTSLVGTLTIWDVAPFRFDVAVERPGSRSFSKLIDARAIVDGGTATYKGGGDCEIVIKRDGEALELKQTGTCRQDFFGVDVSGRYSR